MNKDQIVTVAITTYNHENYISKCIESVLSQTYSNIKIIICDDASTDNTHDHLLKYQSLHPDIITVFLNKKNIGITRTINKVLEHASGSFIAAIGGDDLMYPNKIATQVEFLQENPDCAMCFHDLDIIDLDSNELLSKYSLPENSFCRKRPGTFVDCLKHGCFFHAVGMLYRLDGKTTFAYDTRLPLASDWLYYAELLYKYGSAGYIGSTLGAYGRTPNSITHNRPTDFKLEIDLLNSCNILLFKYPYYRNYILNRSSMIHFGMRLKDPLNYIKHIQLSLKIKFNYKPILVLCLYFLSLGFIKK